MDKAENTSITLLQGLKTSDEAAWDRFLSLYAPMIFRWGKGLGLDDSASEDLTQDVLTKLISRMREFQYDQNRSFRAWLKTICLNHARDSLRKAKVRRATSDVETLAVDADEIEFLSEQEYSGQLVQKAIDLMKSEFEYSTWRACWLSVVEQKSAKQISEELEITVNAVYLAKSRVLRRLRSELDGLLD